jgi:hypothetical protein
MRLSALKHIVESVVALAPADLLVVKLKVGRAKDLESGVSDHVWSLEEIIDLMK